MMNLCTLRPQRARCPWGQGGHLLVKVPLLRVPYSTLAKLIEADSMHKRQNLKFGLYFLVYNESYNCLLDQYIPSLWEAELYLEYCLVNMEF